MRTKNPQIFEETAILEDVDETFDKFETTPINRLTKDLRKASATLAPRQVRYLVDCYYQYQKARIVHDNQCRSSIEPEEPHEALQWLGSNVGMLETQIKNLLGHYAKSNAVGQWLLSVCGIGPVLAAGFLAHIDITKAPTAGHIWSFAGLDPTKGWEKGEVRPWNARLKVLCCAPQTMITTSKGIKPITEIEIGDLVLTHRGRYRPVTEVMLNSFEGELVGIKPFGSSAGNLFITPNHPVYTEIRKQWVAKKGREKESWGAADKVLRAGCLPDTQVEEMRALRTAGQTLEALATLYGCSIAGVSMICNSKTRTVPMENETMWVRADEIKPGWLLLKPRIPCAFEKQKIRLPEHPGCHNTAPQEIEVDGRVAQLLGYFAAEGHVSKIQIGFSFHKNELGYQTSVLKTLREVFKHECLKPQIHDNSWQISCSNVRLAKWLKENCGTNSYDQRIPPVIWNSCSDVRAAFLRALFEGDSYLNEETAQLATVSGQLAHETHALLNSFEISSSISTYGTNAYKVTVNDMKRFDNLVFGGALCVARGSRTFCRSKEEGCWFEAKANTSLEYVGAVYNLEVEEDHSYTANGIAVHNCWKAGKSFVKVSNKPQAYYGRVYKERKEMEQTKNHNLEYADQAKAKLIKFKIGKDTEAYKWYSQDMLPPAHIQQRAERYAVKLFLSHLQDVWYRDHYKEAPPKPFATAILGHAHYIEPPS